ncbi:MAG: hypothetical protein Q4F35_01955 [Akkermansia sp.]|nr:hypothetical protein [Akkermansia sp.]
MKHPLFTAGTAFLLGLNVSVGQTVPVVPKADEEPSSETRGDSLGQELLRVTNEMWFLLSGVSDRAGADVAAPRFVLLVKEAENIGNKLYDAEGRGQDLEALDMLHYRIAEALEDLNSEFASLCRAQCYGSEGLIASFYQAVEAGLFDEEMIAELTLPKPPLSDSEARREIVRLKRLVEPDRAVLETLQTVVDARTAALVVGQLKALSDRLNDLQPEQELANRDFAPGSVRSANDAYAPIEPLLWGIRSEIVRIASLPGYDEAAYDTFSDALDSVYASLGETHSEWFDDVFDASFRTDLDDALHENATTSN